MLKSKALVPIGVLILAAIPCAVQAATLKVIFSGGMQQSASRMVAEFQKSSRSTRIEPILIAEGLDFAQAVEKKPDIYLGFFNEMSNYADNGLFEDVAKLVPAKTLRDFPAGFSDAFAVGKRLLGIPIAGYTTALYYNTGMFKAAGLATPSGSWTWEGAFYAACRKLTRGSANGTSTTYGVTGLTCNQFGQPGTPNPSFLSTIYSYGGSIANKQFTKQMYTEKPAMDAIKFILKLHSDKVADITDYPYDQGDAAGWPFWNGKAGMMLATGPGRANKPPFNFGSAPWAKGKEPKFVTGISVIPKGPKGTIVANMTQVASVMVTSKSSKEAGDFLKFLATAKGQEAIFDATGALPTTRAGFDVKSISKGVPAPIYKAYQSGRAWSARKGYINVEFSMWMPMMGIAKGESTMADLLEVAKTQVPEIFANSTYSF